MDTTGHAKWLFAGLGDSYDVVAEILSFGQNRRWRRFMVSRVTVSERGRVLDVATGTAAVALDLARKNNAFIVGLDQSEPMLDTALRRVGDAGVRSRIHLVAGQAERLPFHDASFDAVTFTYLLRYVHDPSATLKELARVLRQGGTLAGLEFHVPGSALSRALWIFYTRVALPVAGSVISGAWGEVGRFLGRSISNFYAEYPLDDQLAMWRSVGVKNVRKHVMSVGGGIVIWGTKGGE